MYSPYFPIYPLPSSATSDGILTVQFKHH